MQKFHVFVPCCLPLICRISTDLAHTCQQPERAREGHLTWPRSIVEIVIEKTWVSTECRQEQTYGNKKNLSLTNAMDITYIHTPHSTTGSTFLLTLTKLALLKAKQTYEAQSSFKSMAYRVKLNFNCLYTNFNSNMWQTNEFYIFFF